MMSAGLFTLPTENGTGPKLVGGYCKKCRRYFFPKPKFCRKCFSDVEEINLDSVGTLYSFTVVRTKPPFGLPEPYAVGYVDLDQCGLRIFALLDPLQVEDLAIGRSLKLMVGQIGQNIDGQDCLRPYFTMQEVD
jgi:uncharacterized OB-fold protein